MDETALKAHTTTIKELLLDEQKLITYTSLSKDLCIHVNEAKSLINRVILDIRQSEPKIELNVCYLVSGLLDDKSACTKVCPETDLDSLRRKLMVTYYEHVYCVSKKAQAIDNVSLTALNKFEDFSLCIGHIKDSSCIKRTENELVSLRNVKPDVFVETKANGGLPKSAKIANKENNNHRTTEVNKESSGPSKVEVKTELKSPNKVITPKNTSPVKKNNSKPSKGIAGFFKQNGDSKKLDKCNGHSDKQNKNNELTEKQRSHNENIEKSNKSNGFSDKQNKNHEISDKLCRYDESTDQSNKSNRDSEKDIKIRNSKTEVKVKIEPKHEDSQPTNGKSKNKKKSNKETKSSLTKSVDNKKTAKVDKKRKRIINDSDSDSDTETNDPFAEEKMALDDESEDEIPPTPTVNTVKITSGMINPKKKRKIVDKTYTDEDGYILTKKEEVYESCSDTEENNVPQTESSSIPVVQEPVKQTTKKVTSPKENVKGKKKKVSPPKGKQSMMTNFFKKV